MERPRSQSMAIKKSFLSRLKAPRSMPLFLWYARGECSLQQMIFQSSKFLRPLLNWFDHNRRDLPWRLPRDARSNARLDPYHVFVSEAMLQQTQVSTVVPYFLRFIEKFPTAHALAQADQQQVLRLWQGLGYYSRARHLHAAAKTMVRQFHGKVPDTVESLLTLPGVGRY